MSTGKSTENILSPNTIDDPSLNSSDQLFTVFFSVTKFSRKIKVFTSKRATAHEKFTSDTPKYLVEILENCVID
jgi:hypothetical protein